MRIDLAGHVLDAHSVGGIETCFQIASFDVNLDIGRCPEGAVARRTLLLSHAHIDHAAGLPYFVSMRAMRRLPPPRIFCPAGVRDRLAQLLAVWSGLDADAERCELVGLSPGDRVPLGSDRSAVAFRACHRVETLGYCLIQRRRRLRPEYRGLDGPAIAAAVARGEAVHDPIEVPEICFAGDTSAEVVEREALVRTARLLLLECTFVGDGPEREWARAGGHVHLDDLAERADLFENEAILLTHFSKRYPPSFIEDAVRRRLPKGLSERVHLLLH